MLPQEGAISYHIIYHQNQVFFFFFSTCCVCLVYQMMIMAQGSKHISMMMPKELDTNHNWVIMERPRSEDGEDDHSVSSFSGSDESTTNSDASSSDLMEDASSNGPLYELSELMSHLPIKRGLSKYYQGKSESFTSLASVHNFEDLAKKERPCKRKSKSCGDINKCSYSPKAAIAKKVQRGSFLSSSVLNRKSVLYKRAFNL